MKILKESQADLANKIASATDKNDHTGALILLAQGLKDKKAEKALEGIDACNIYFGHSPQELLKVRTMISDNLLKQAKNKFNDEDYKVIYKAF